MKQPNWISHTLLMTLERGFVILALLFFSRIPLFFHAEGERMASVSAGEGSLGVRLLFGAIYLLVICIAILARMKIWSFLVKRQWLCGLLLLVLVSPLWSPSYFLSFRRSVALILTTVFGIYLGVRFTEESHNKILATFFSLVILLNVGFILLVPEYGIMSGTHEGLWRGCFRHKNDLGVIMSLSVLFFFTRLAENRKGLTSVWIGFVASVVLLAASGSRTSIVAALGTIVLFTAWSLFRKNFRALMPALLAAVIIIMARENGFGVSRDITSSAILHDLSVDEEMGELSSYPDIGADQNVMGRVVLWEELYLQGSDRKLLGFGYGGFWLTGQKYFLEVWTNIGWSPFQAHNGLVEIWINLGVVGVLLFLLEYLNVWGDVVRRVRLGIMNRTIWPALFLCQLPLANLLESTLLIRHSIPWIFYVSVSFSLLRRNPELRDR